MVNFSRYNPPGVYSEETPGPQLGTNSGTPQCVAIVGEGSNIMWDQETFSMVGQEAVQLRRSGVNVASIIVANATITFTAQVTSTNGEGETTIVTAGDYIVTPVTGTNGQAVVNIARVDGARIKDGESVTVTYSYLDNTYYDVRTLYTYSDIVDLYGAALKSTSNGDVINSPLTLAAQYAILNGASQLVTVAVKPTGENGVANTQDYQAALDKISDHPDVSLVCTTMDATAIGTFVAAHVNANSKSKFERRAIIGFDGTKTAVSSSARISTAQTIKHPRVMVTSPDVIQLIGPSSGSVNVPGWTMAAALAGYTISHNVSTPLTRKTLLGFSDLPEKASESQKTAESQGGLCVIEKTVQGAIRVRHGVSSDPTDIVSREWSITGQRDEQILRMRNSLDNNNIIGSIITDTTLVNVKATASGTLEALVSDGTIRGYSGLQVRQLITEPDVIEIRYAWLANAPLNYVVVSFSLNLTTGETSESSTETTE